MTPLGGPQIQFPVLADQVVAEGMMRLLAHQGEARRLVEVAGGEEDVVSPQGQGGVAGLAGETRGLVDQAGADAEAACLGVSACGWRTSL